MRNADHENDGLRSAFSRRIRRNRRAAIGLAGLAAVLGAGALLVTDRAAETSGAIAEPGAQAAHVAPSPPSRSPAGPTKPSAAPSSARAKSPSRSATATSVQERLDAARSANKRLGTEVRRPLTAAAAQVDPAKVKVMQTGSNRVGRMMRVSSARLDLTGYRELAWVRDGKRHGDATCTQKITVSPDVPPRERPTLLICWRTSAKKSVYTVAVDFKKRPPVAASIAELEKAWAAMR